MRYLSVCSGIEAATVAWHPLGWTPVGFSEIEPFPSSVLAHHYPGTPNFGDMTKHEAWPLGPGSIDLLVGGTPCQSFSVAGLRKGLADPRGNLMLTYLAIADRLRPRWIVWENVPGVLSSNGGRDFGTFLGALGELGYGWAYRVVDAQWVRSNGHPRAVPQRRRRVFVVGCFGDSRSAAAVLFERESVCRDTAPRRTQGKGAAAGTGSRVARMRGIGDLGSTPVAYPLQDGREIDKRQNGVGVGGNGDPAYTVDCTGAQAVALEGAISINEEVATTLSARDYKGPSCGRDGVTGNPVATCTVAVPTLTASNDPSRSPQSSEVTQQVAAVYAATLAVRRLTPRECERLQGFPDDYTAVLHKGKPAADGPRYKALGNSMAVNCMEWIGERIAAQGSPSGAGLPLNTSTSVAPE